MKTMILALLACLLALALAGCAPGPTAPEGPMEAGAPAGFPAADYLSAQRPAGRVYRIDPGRSQVLIRVHRAGSLARLGHNHIVASRDVQGYVLLAEDPDRSRADLYLPVARLVVDDPDLRAAAGEGFAYPLEPHDVEATRRNMLGEKVLDAAHHPFLQLAISVRERGEAQWLLNTAIALRGRTTRLTAPARVEENEAGLLASGRLEVSQRDLGLTPFSVLGGALQVRDRLDVTYRLTATPLP
jgi:hypothetical protein